MKQYESYKDSGIEWLGRIPSHWTPIAMKFYFYMKGRIGWQGLKADEFIEEGPYLVTGTDFENGKVIWERCYHISEERYNEAPEIYVEKGDLLITKDGTVGKLAFIDEKPEKVSLNSHLLILRPVKPNMDNHFIYWALQAENFVYYTGLAQNGSIMASLSQEKIGDYKIALPSIAEQQAIASFLNHRVGLVDAAIAEKEQMLEDLKAYRSAIISEVVTKGLGKNVEMKDSDIDRFPMIPSNWKTSKLKYIASIRSGSALSIDQIKEDALYEVYGGNGCIGKTDVYNAESPAIIIGRVGALCGNVHLIKTNKWVTDNALILNIKRDITYDYIYFYLSTYNLNTLNSSNAQPLITGTKVLDVVVPIPSFNEQIMIASYLYDKISKIDETIEQVGSQIDDFKSYKSALITEAVTGKVDLRDWKSNSN